MKYESDLTKLARWVVPGWVGILSSCAFVVLDIAFSSPGKSCTFPSITAFITTISGLDPVLTAILFAASGVPLGFLIYQAYFFLRWNSPFSRDGLLPPLLTGRMNDLDRVMRSLQLSEMTGGVHWRDEWVQHPLFKHDHGFRWRYIELLFTEAAQRIDSAFEGVSIYGRHRYLHEIVHTLGASVGAVYLGFLGYTYVRFHNDVVSLPIYMLVLFVLAFAFLTLLGCETRRLDLSGGQGEISPSVANDPGPAIVLKFRLFKYTIRLSIVHPGSLFVFSLVMIHLFANPVLNPSPTTQDLLVKLAVALLAVLIWTQSKKNPSAAVRAGDYLVLSLSLVLAIAARLVPPHLLFWIDWPFFTTALAFITANLLLLKNRHNARLDMLALEYYTLRQYLTERQHKDNS